MAFYGTDIDDNQLNNPESVQYGGGGNDQLEKNNAAFRAYGGDGNDALLQTGNFYMDAWGGYGNDFIYVFNTSGSCYLHGDEDQDVILAGGGPDYIDGGLANDALYGNGDNDTIYGGEGDDNAAFTITAGTGNSGYTSTRLAGLYGGSGDDYLDGGRGDDTLYGETDADTLLGGEGNDALDGGSGIDRMSGGAGNDRFTVDDAKDVVTEASGDGSDTVIASVSYGLKAGCEVERLSTTGSSGSSAINLTGNDVGQRIDGNAAGNKLVGLGGNDTLYGINGNDALYGGDGRDVLSGGVGNDSFVFDSALNASTNIDTIADFHNVSGDNDTIRLDNAIFAKLTTTGYLNAANLAANATGTAADANDYVVYNIGTGALFYDADGNGAGKAIQFATVTGHPALTAADFLVV